MATDTQKKSIPPKRDLTKGPIMGHVLRMSVPMAIGIGALISFTIADAYFIGQLGATELAAIVYTIPITTLFFNLMFGFAIAMSATVSRKIGSGLRDEVRVTATIGIMMAVLVSSSVALLGYLTMETIFRGLGAGPETMPFIRDYIPIWCVGSVFLAVPVVANSAIRGTGDAFWPAVIMVLIAIINVILDPILIFGLLGAPALGVKGAAIASTIAYICAMVVALSILSFREKLFAPLCIFKKASWALVAKPILMIAIPVSLASIIAPLMTYGYTAILSEMGDDIVAGFGIASRLEAFSLIPIMAVAGGMAPLVGQNFGAGLQDRVAEALRKALTFSIGYGVFCAVVFYAISDVVAKGFSDDVNIQNTAALYLAVVPVSYIGVNIFAVITSMMNATGMPKQALTLNILKSFIIGLPLAYVLTDMYGLEGFITSIVATNIVAMIVCLFFKKRIRCIEACKSVS